MKSILDYTDEELNAWVLKVRTNRDDIRSGRLKAFNEVKKEKREKVERKARDSGIEVVEMDDIMKAFLK